MLTASIQSPPSASNERSDLGVPLWAVDLLGRAAARRDVAGAVEIRTSETAGYSLVTVHHRDAASLDAAAFEACTRDAYAAIARGLRACAARNPVRLWNYIPAIHRPCGVGLDRYMRFNAGRFAACSDWLGGPDTFDRLLATGSGVGHAGTDLVIHALAAAHPGTAVENPRQIPAYRYSRRFGPLPPCFSRATILRRPSGLVPLLLVGGTASIRGEESVHVGDLRRQTFETFENLASLLCSAPGGSSTPGLDAYRALRVYHVSESDRAPVAALVEAAFPSIDHVEYLRADLCRRELAVEIEGVAELSDE